MWPLLLPLMFVLLPIVEIYVIIQVAQAIGGWWTALLLVAETVLGLWFVKREGKRAWSSLNATVAQGKMPDRELADGFLILAGGVLLIVPGFVTDVFGFLCVLPFTRPLVRRVLMVWAERRAAKIGAPAGFPGAYPGGPVFPGQGDVIRGEVVEEEDRPAGPIQGQILRGDVVRDDEDDTR
ncbi:FxsA family protein [Actinocorallia sp. A-T 12471]|uniref:FxsA family protein n=1 Tax=Actinocorallia sp. A-T 12471 TaxID=3089813 RepID=UPI0029CF706B|nr:FxsA family protein [Actinocorallia sp. A-T 12471]MDX6741213.1 FxsA family protein [Actinocorallia sp. A-T 12471]